MMRNTISMTFILGTALVLAAIAAGADERIVGLKGQPNFRDIGGYETSDGRKIKTGLIYRSGELPRLTDNDIAKLRELGIKTVVNFLTPAEIEYRGKDRLPEGIHEINIPITGEIEDIPDAIAALIEARKTGDFRKFPPSFNRQVHTDLVSGVADQQYGELFELLTDKSNYPLVYHCSHGVHRTGTATALLLSALNVPWQTVREDYLLSNIARAPEVEPRLKELQDLSQSVPMSAAERQDNERATRAFYILEPAYIDASRDAATAQHGSLDRYLEEGLGVDAARKQALRDHLTRPKSTAEQ